MHGNNKLTNIASTSAIYSHHHSAALHENASASRDL